MVRAVFCAFVTGDLAAQTNTSSVCTVNSARQFHGLDAAGAETQHGPHFSHQALKAKIGELLGGSGDPPDRRSGDRRYDFSAA
jgi:hypothetical protein